MAIPAVPDNIIPNAIETIEKLKEDCSIQMSEFNETENDLIRINFLIQNDSFQIELKGFSCWSKISEAQKLTIDELLESLKSKKFGLYSINYKVS